MKNIVCRLAKQLGRVFLVSLALALNPNAQGSDVHLDMLKTRTACFTNVTVYNRSATDLFIRHARGFGNVKISDVSDADALRVLGLHSPSPEAREPGEEASAVGPGLEALKLKMNPLAREQFSQWQKNVSGITAIRLSPNVITLVVAFFLGLYLFFCHCLKLICQKTGNPPGFLIWLPVLQMLPLLRAASMSRWWFLAFCIPVLNLVAQILWSIKIVQARGKSVWVIIGLLLPVTNVAALLYLAFSDGHAEEPAENRKFALAGEPLPIEG